jgi:hypothetical protein
LDSVTPDTGTATVIRDITATTVAILPIERITTLGDRTTTAALEVTVTINIIKITTIATN